MLSCATIAAAAATLVVLFTTDAATSGSGALGPIQSLLFDARMLWVLSAVAALVLLIGIPRPRSAPEWAPRVLAIIAAVMIGFTAFLPAWFAYLQVAVMVVAVMLDGLGLL